MLSLPVAITLSVIVMAISVGTGVFLDRYKAGVTEMLGMMIGMTQGMMTGIAVGFFIGAATDMFISNLVGVIIGVLFGIIFGRVGGLMGMMDGGMGGMMGGMMGAMLGLMLQYLYNGWAINITSLLMSTLYIVSMIALVRLVQKSAAATMEIDLVCGMKVDPKTSLQYTYQGKVYYFCAPSCKRSFAKKPEDFIKVVSAG
jgi:YHS domain-containing protein